MFKVNSSSSRKLTALSASGRRYAFVSLSPEDHGFRLDDVRVGIRSNGATGDTLKEVLPPGYGKTGVTELIEGRCVFTKLIKLPPMSKDEALTTIRITERESVPFDITLAHIDLWIDENHRTGMMNALMVAAKEEELDYRKERLRGSSFHLARLSTAPAAIGALLDKSNVIVKSDQNIFIEIKDNVTQIHIFQNGSLLFARDIHFGIGEALDALINHEGPGKRKLNKADALDILENCGIPDGEVLASEQIPPEFGNELIVTPMEKIAKEIRRTLDYFERGASLTEVKHCWITGVGAGIKNIAVWLEPRIGLKTKVYNPFDDFLKAPILMDKPEHIIGPAIAIAVGLAIDNGRSISLPRSSLGGARRSWLKHIPKPVLAASIFLLAFGFAVYSGWSAFARVDSKIAKERLAISALEERLSGDDYSAARLASVNANIELLRDSLTRYPQLSAVAIDWVAMFKKLGRLMPRSMRLTGFDVDISEGGKVLLRGIVKGGGRERLINVSQLLSDMESSEYFARAQIVNTMQTVDGELLFVISSHVTRLRETLMVKGDMAKERG